MNGGCSNEKSTAITLRTIKIMRLCVPKHPVSAIRIIPMRLSQVHMWF